MFRGIVLISCLLLAVQAQAPWLRDPYGHRGYNPYGLGQRHHLYDEAPKPYAFQYEAPAIGGASSRQESADGSGRVVGSYSLSDEDGRQRVVEYVADEAGFQATVHTNEPGTKSDSPANVLLNSAAPPTVYPDAGGVRPGHPYGSLAGGYGRHYGGLRGLYGGHYAGNHLGRYAHGHALHGNPLAHRY